MVFKQMYLNYMHLINFKYQKYFYLYTCEYRQPMFLAGKIYLASLSMSYDFL